MLDQTSINNFIVENKIVNGMMIFDKGFYNEDLFERIDKMEGLSDLIPCEAELSLHQELWHGQSY